MNNVMRANDRAAGTRTLFVSTVLPWNLELDRHGVFQRMRMLLDAVLRTSGSVDVLMLASSGETPDLARLAAIEEWMQRDLGDEFKVTVLPVVDLRWRFTARHPRLSWLFGFSPLLRPTIESLRAIKKHLDSRGDSRIFVHRLPTMALLLKAGLPRFASTVLDLDDIEHLAQARLVASPPKWRAKPLRYVHCLPLLIEEWRALRRCDRVLVCSDDDVRRLSWMDIRRVAASLPNAVAEPPATPEPEAAVDPVVLFVGTLGYEPNRAGILWFAERIWPLVLRSHPRARLVVVGKGSENLPIRDDVAESVERLGFVESLDDAYNRAMIVVCPLLSGGGTRIKIIEAAARRRPVVSTTVGAEGLAFIKGQSIELADQPEDFAAAVCGLLDDSERRQALSMCAREVYATLYERDAVRSRLEHLVREAWQDRHAPLPV